MSEYWPFHSGTSMNKMRQVTALACDVCEGSGHKTERGKTHSGHDFMTVRHQEPCSACHGTGLAGVEWRCWGGDRAQFCERMTQRTLKHGNEIPEQHAKCGLVLVVPLERSETHA